MRSSVWSRRTLCFSVFYERFKGVILALQVGWFTAAEESVGA
jgi:hypothetical protein